MHPKTIPILSRVADCFCMNIEYVDHHLEKFVRSLEPQTIAKVIGLVRKLHEHGHDLGMPHSRHLGSRLYELRIRGAQEVRIFYTVHENVIFLLHGFVKKTMRTPPKELAKAKQKCHLLERP